MLICLFKSSCFGVAYCKEGASSTDGELSSTSSMKITSFDEGSYKLVSFETQDVEVDAREAQLLEAVDRSRNITAEWNIVFLANVTRLQ